MIAAALLIALQAAPDIQIGARVQARSGTIERRGEARIEVRAEPDGGTKGASQTPPAADKRAVRNLDVRLDVEARIAAPETATAPPR